MSRPTHGYCSNCNEDSAINAANECLWCGSPTEQRTKRPAQTEQMGSRYTEPQLRVLHQAHERGESVSQLARKTYERVGYGSAGAASYAIRREWKRMGLPVRDPIAATVLASTKHGLAPKHRPQIGYSAYKRRVHRDQPDRPPCAGVRENYPRKGEPCGKPAMHDSEFCWNHDPARRDEAVVYLAQGRRRHLEEMLSAA